MLLLLPLAMTENATNTAWGQSLKLPGSGTPALPDKSLESPAPSPTESTTTTNKTPTPEASDLPLPSKSSVPVVSEAERIATLQRTIEADEQRVKDLQKDLDDPKSPYLQAEQDFKTVSEQQDSLKKQAKQAETDGNAELLKELNEKLVTVEKSWEEAKRRFELEIETRKTRRASLDSLTTRLATNKELLEKLRNPTPTTPSPTTPGTTTPPVPGTTTPPTTTMSQPPAAGGATTELPQVEAPAATTIDPATGMPLLPTTPNGITPATPAPQKDKDVLAAESVVDERRQQLEEAQAELDGITQRTESLQENIQLERRLRDIARQKSIESTAESKRLREEYWRQLSAGEAATETGQKLEDALSRQQTANEEARAASNHLDELQSSLTELQAEQLAAVRLVERRRREKEQAEQELRAVASPWSLKNIQVWLLNRGTRILGAILIGMFLLTLARTMRPRIIHLLMLRDHGGSKEERENRARTLVSVFHNAFITAVYGFVIVVILEELGYSVAPLLGGAAVLGLAVAFGAQSLIKDYFTGFIVLLEQQYMLNDVVKLGGVSGQVERITLRMTVLRDLEGHVHFIPHGQITTVTNMTHIWSRALFEISISYGSDIDRATRLLMELARDLRRDPAYASLIIDEPAMLGVDQLADSAVIIKFYVATRPLHQWTVKRELLRRIKLRFDEEGINIPFPQLTVHTEHHAAPAIPKAEPIPENPLLS